VVGQATAQQIEQLAALGWVESNGPNELAIAFYELLFERGEEAAALELYRDAVLAWPVTQALVQGLHGRGTVAFDQVLHFLARHRMVAIEAAPVARSLLTLLNKAGVLTWSNKNQTVRMLAKPPDDTIEPSPAIRVIEKERPFSNALHIRQMLRDCSQYIWWVEPHLPRKALEHLVAEGDGERISQIRLISMPQDDPLLAKDFERFAREMKALGIDAQWRLVPRETLALHDRYIIGATKVWNLPPVNSIHKGDYSEAFPTPNRPPFEQWWEAGTSLPKT
jgi:hypothetical protein